MEATHFGGQLEKQGMGMGTTILSDCQYSDRDNKRVRQQSYEGSSPALSEVTPYSLLRSSISIRMFRLFLLFTKDFCFDHCSTNASRRQSIPTRAQIKLDEGAFPTISVTENQPADVATLLKEYLYNTIQYQYMASIRNSMDAQSQHRT